MKLGVVIFPGSNCDQDLIEVLKQHCTTNVVELWHKDTDLQGSTHVFIPGGFSYGDYLRSGAIAKLSPIMAAVKEHAARGGFVMGICNGFQILCEAGLLEGALLRNENQLFVCQNVFLTPHNCHTSVTHALDVDKAYKIPIAHAEGRFYADAETISRLEYNDQIIFRYSSEDGETSPAFNPNGSVNNIAGICNAEQNVFGMMPHPERAASADLFNTDGLLIFKHLLSPVVSA
ncbi:MAG: phosphoribosylformylglycinamidine synthase I [Bacteroidia bacterium]|jgi:phosphoribosylformylglycinamidine synthase I